MTKEYPGNSCITKYFVFLLLFPLSLSNLYSYRSPKHHSNTSALELDYSPFVPNWERWPITGSLILFTRVVQDAWRGNDNNEFPICYRWSWILISCRFHQICPPHASPASFTTWLFSHPPSVLYSLYTISRSPTKNTLSGDNKNLLSPNIRRFSEMFLPSTD